MVYLASPYTHSSHAIQEERFLAVSRIVAHFLPINRAPVFSPILYAHELAKNFSLATDFQSWLRFNNAMLRLSNELWVLRLDGWEESKGVKHELAVAEFIGTPIHYLDENGAFVL